MIPRPTRHVTPRKKTGKRVATKLAKPARKQAAHTEPAKGLWGGRFEGGLAPEMRPLNLSLDVDRRLWREDVRGSRAWARALVGAGVLTEAEAKRLDAGLARVAARLEGGAPVEGAADEDVHSLVERLLFEEAGDVAGKLHPGRSQIGS